MSDETVVVRVDNVALVMEHSSSTSEDKCLVTLDDFRRFAGDIFGSVQLTPAQTEEVKEAGGERLAQLFGSWDQADDDDQQLKELYESRLAPSGPLDE